MVVKKSKKRTEYEEIIYHLTLLESKQAAVAEELRLGHDRIALLDRAVVTLRQQPPRHTVDVYFATMLPEERRRMRELLGNPDLHCALTDEEKAFCINNQVITAIKSIRERLHIGLVEAKDMTDAFREGRRNG